MKIFIPKHIDGWMFSMHISIWPFTVTIVQLFIIAFWVAFSLMIWNSLVKDGLPKVIAFFLVVPILLIFFVFAFFKLSELKLIPFIAKLIRTYFIDETVKYHINYGKIDPVEIKLYKLKHNEVVKKQETKVRTFDKEKLVKLSEII